MTMLDAAVIPIPTGNDVKKRLAEVRQLVADLHLEAALLLAWATMAAVARATVHDKFAKPQPPGRIVEALAMDGYITPTEADHVRSLISKRNSLAHGDLGVCVTSQEIEQFTQTIERLYELAPA